MSTVLAGGLLTGPASAGFSDTATSGGLAVGTATLLGPATLSAVSSCSLLSARTTLTWPVTASTFATGYVVTRRLTGVGPYVTVATVPGLASTTWTSSALATGTGYQYVVQASFEQWTGPSPVASTTTPALCLV